MFPDTGAYVITGHDPSMSAGIVLAVDTGSYTYTGYSATFQVNRAIAVDTGSYAVTGFAPSILASTSTRATKINGYMIGVEP
jgi:hypothetical protein